eukprot:4337412-Prymnesium_polylepis.1
MVQVASGLSFSLSSSAFVALAGPVSAGKTSVLAAAWAEAQLMAGSISGKGRAVGGVGIVPQRPFTIRGTVLGALPAKL